MSFPGKLLESMAFRGNESSTNSGSVAHFAHIKIPMRIDTCSMRNKEIAWSTAILIDTPPQDTAIQVVNTDMTG